jgi:hypothetical protein
MIAEESIESDKVEDPKSTNTRGTKQKKKSVESVELSNPSSEVEPTPSTNVEISV